MKVCIAGGGRVGRYLAQSLLAHRHKVTIIEPQEMLCRSLADSLDIPVICGDAISFDTMRTADVASCDAFVAVTGADERGGGTACGKRGAQIGKLVADHHRVRQGNVMVFRRLQQHSRMRLAAVAVAHIFHDCAFGVMGAIIPCERKRCASGGQQVADPAFNGGDVGKGEVSARDSGLVRGDDDPISGSGDLAERFDASRAEPDLRGIGKIVFLFDDDAVAVKEESLIHRVPRFLRARLSPHRRMRRR